MLISDVRDIDRCAGGPRLNVVQFSDQTRAGAFNVIWPLAAAFVMAYVYTSVLRSLAGSTVASL